MQTVAMVALGALLHAGARATSAVAKASIEETGVASDVQTLTALLAKEGRGHLTVRAEGKQLLVSSVGEDGGREDHLRFAPDGKGYVVDRFDGKRWVKAGVSGSLEACVDGLLASGAGAPPK